VKAGNPTELPGEKAQSAFISELREQWPLVAVLFLIQVFAFGFPTFALPFVYSGATEEFGWTRQQAVLLSSFKFCVSAVAALAAGRMLDRTNPKYVVAASAALGALGMAGFTIADQLPTYYLLGMILGLSAAGLAVSINVIVSRAFEKSTGTMLGIVLTGTSVAGVALPLLMAPLMKSIGWRPAMALLSTGIWIVALPAWLRLTRRGCRAGERLKAAVFTSARTGMWRHFREMAGARDFWFIFAGIFLVSAVDQSMVQNQVLFLKSEKGLSLDMVKWGAAVLAGVGIGGKILFGWIFDKLSILGIAACYVLVAISVGLTFGVSGVGSMLAFVTLMGTAHAGYIVSGPVLLKYRYGTQNIGLKIGMSTLCASIGFGIGPPFMASMADRSGTYSGAFAIGIAAVLVAAILLLPVRREGTPPISRGR
jgi:sugar phosphate permease